ncbi:MAG: GDP-mannose 4,6-dehydratase, partial [Gammaproteobacteria bacterium]|nr:GDP-mannose 4,6-dehydratase [Gammaproteobacteria bacterium]
MGNFWSKKRVLVTGHTGFKGAWLSLWLQSLGAKVTGYALAAPTDPSLFELANVATGMNSIEGDVRDLNSLDQAFKASQPEIVFHLAAQALVRESYKDPVNTYSTNVIGTVHVLELVR